jgi:hypothetical protein
MDSSSDPTEPLAILWDALLSREPKRIQRVYNLLDAPARKAITAHLQRMVSEADWHPEQRTSAQAALDAIRELG